MLGNTLLNRYRLEAELGQGGMGTVYRAQDVLLDRPVAIKVLSQARLGANGRARLLHEARAVARLNHPNIMAIYDVADAGAGPERLPVGFGTVPIPTAPGQPAAHSSQDFAPVAPPAT